MTLATTCPQCATTFRVQAEQLRQRGGMVRCGVCRHAFNALDALQPLGGEPQPGLPAAATPSLNPTRVDAHAGIGAGARDAAGMPADDAHLPGLLRPSRQPAAAPLPVAPFGPADGPVLSRPADVEAVPARPAPQSGPFALPRKPDRAAFAIRAGLVATLAVAAVLQIALLSRDALAAWAPGLKPALAALAGTMGLRVEPPRRLSSLTIEGFDLQAGSEPSQLVLSAVLRNTGGTPTQWPAMELTLTDASGAVVVRKALLPVEYLRDTARLEAGIDARSELPISLVLQTPQVRSTRYGVSLFYP